MEAEIFEQQHVAVGECIDGSLSRGADAVVSERDGRAQRLAHGSGDGLQREAGIRALRPAEVREHDDLGAALGQIAQAGDDTFKPGGVGHLAVGDGHVEVAADEHALAGDVDTGGCFQLVEVHGGGRTPAVGRCGLCWLYRPGSAGASNPATQWKKW